MTGLDQDPLGAVFDVFRSEVAPLVRSPGLDRTRASVHTRRRNRNVMLGALGALVIAIPAGAQAVSIADHHRLQAAARMTIAELKRAELSVPSWPADSHEKDCPTGYVRFQSSSNPDKPAPIAVDAVAYVDVDHNGIDETIARITCPSTGFYPFSQVVALQRSRSGAIRTLGRVVGQNAGGTDGICGLRAGANGAVEVQLMSIMGPGGCVPTVPGAKPDPYIVYQWRTYAWVGSRFVQRGGPASFPASRAVADLSISNSGLVMVRQEDGQYRGSMTVTVHNGGIAPFQFRTDTVVPSDMSAKASSGFTVGYENEGGGLESVVCTGAAIPAAASRTATLILETSHRTDSFSFQPASSLSIPGDFWDPNSDNDQASLKIRYEG